MTTSTGTTPCTVDVEKQLWDLSATLTATYYDKTDMDEPVGFVHVNQELVVKVIVVLKGNISRYLCETELCVSGLRSLWRQRKGRNLQDAQAHR